MAVPVVLGKWPILSRSHRGAMWNSPAVARSSFAALRCRPPDQESSHDPSRKLPLRRRRLRPRGRGGRRDRLQLLDVPPPRRPARVLPARSADADHAGIELRHLPLQQGTPRARSEEPTSELQSLMRISYAVFRFKKKNTQITKISTR